MAWFRQKFQERSESCKSKFVYWYDKRLEKEESIIMAEGGIMVEPGNLIPRKKFRLAFYLIWTAGGKFKIILILSANDVYSFHSH